MVDRGAGKRVCGMASIALGRCHNVRSRLALSGAAVVTGGAGRAGGTVIHRR